jgi:hypothetical protein
MFHLAHIRWQKMGQGRSGAVTRIAVELALDMMWSAHTAGAEPAM